MKAQITFEEFTVCFTVVTLGQDNAACISPGSVNTVPAAAWMQLNTSEITECVLAGFGSEVQHHPPDVWGEGRGGWGAPAGSGRCEKHVQDSDRWTFKTETKLIPHGTLNIIWWWTVKITVYVNAEFKCLVKKPCIIENVII